MKNLLVSTPGRLLALAIGVAIGGGGLSKMVDGGGLLIGSVTVLVAVAIMIVGLAESVEEHFGAAAVFIVVLPVLTFLGEVGVQLAPRALGWPLVVVALPFLAFAARARASAPASQPRLEL
ncbi:MAG TPA: hypothetical protein VGM56_11615, partial [Byssovorax sp.]